MYTYISIYIYIYIYTGKETSHKALYRTKHFVR